MKRLILPTTLALLTGCNNPDCASSSSIDLIEQIAFEHNWMSNILYYDKRNMSQENRDSYKKGINFDGKFTTDYNNGVTFSVDDIILISTDDSTEKVECKAKLTAEVPGWGSDNEKIRYTIEKTSDGDLYATVYRQ
jgi:hypothetical protein